MIPNSVNIHNIYIYIFSLSENGAAKSTVFVYHQTIRITSNFQTHPKTFVSIITMFAIKTTIWEYKYINDIYIYIYSSEILFALLLGLTLLLLLLFVLS